MKNPSRTPSSLLGLAADEVLAERPAPDLAPRLRVASAAQRRRAAIQAETAAAAWESSAAPHPGPRIAAVALAAAIAGVVLLDVEPPAQVENPGGTAALQDLHHNVVHPKDEKHLQQLLAAATGARTQTNAQDLSTPLTPAGLKFLQAEFAPGLKGIEAKHPYVFEPMLELVIQVDKRRVLLARVEREHAAPRAWFVRIQGLSLQVANRKTVAQLKTWRALHQRDLRARVTSARSLDDLRRLLKVPAADRPQRLRLIGLEGDCLPLLEPLSTVRYLDVTKSPDVLGASLAQFPIAAQVTEVRLTTTQLGERPAWISRLRRLQHLTVTAPRLEAHQFVNGAKCITCHRGGGNRPQAGLPRLDGLHKSRSLRSLSLQGVIMSEDLWKLVAGLPLLHRLDLSCSELDGLDTTALKSLSNLRALHLGGCFGLSDEDVEFLCTQKHLRHLDLRGARPKQIQRVQDALPRCDVRG